MPVKNRRPAREAALSGLYLIEFSNARGETALEHLESYQSLSEDLQAYAQRLVHGVFHARKDLDQRISAKLKGYDLSRVAAVDRNLLRIAVFELFEVDDVPPRVTLDEAIELAKKYSTAESGKFVNGVLAAILPESPKANWVPPAVEAAVEEAAAPEPEPVVEEVAEDSPELAQVGKWKLRSEEPEA